MIFGRSLVYYFDLLRQKSGHKSNKSSLCNLRAENDKKYTRVFLRHDDKNTCTDVGDCFSESKLFVHMKDH